MKPNPINLELTFTDVDSLRDYLKHYSYKYGELRWRKLFVLYGIAGCVKHPFIWYSPLTKEYHVDVRVDHRLEAYGNLPRRKWDKINEEAMIVYWDSSYSKNSMVMRTFEDKWCWSDKAIQEILFYGDIYEKLSININVYEAKKYREYTPMFRIKRKKDDLSEEVDHLFELEFHNVSHLVSYLEAHEKDERISIVHYWDYKEEEYPLVIRQESPYDGSVSYFIDVWTKSRKYLCTFGYHAYVHEIKDQGLYDGKPSHKYYAEVWSNNKRKYFPMHEGRYRFRSYEPDWSTEKELNDKYIKNGIVKGSDVNEVLGLDSKTVVARGNGKSFRQLKEAFEQYMSTGNPIVAVDRKISIHDMYPTKPIFKLDDLDTDVRRYIDSDIDVVKHTIDFNNIMLKEDEKDFGVVDMGTHKLDCKVDVYNKEKLDRFLQPKPILRFDDLDEKTLKYIDTDVTACVEYYSNKELKERMNIMFGVDLNKIPEIKDVKFNNPATIVFWADGTKTVVKRQKGDRFDKEKGLAMAIVKKLFGNKGNYNELFKKWIKEDK